MCWCLSLVSAYSCAYFTWPGDTNFMVFSSGAKTARSRADFGGFWRKLQENSLQNDGYSNPQKDRNW